MPITGQWQKVVTMWSFISGHVRNFIYYACYSSRRFRTTKMTLGSWSLQIEKCDRDWDFTSSWTMSTPVSSIVIIWSKPISIRWSFLWSVYGISLGHLYSTWIDNSWFECCYVQYRYCKITIFFHCTNTNTNLSW